MLAFARSPGEFRVTWWRATGCDAYGQGVDVETAVRRVGDLTILDLSGKILGGPESDSLRLELDRILASVS